MAHSSLCYISEDIPVLKTVLDFNYSLGEMFSVRKTTASK